MAEPTTREQALEDVNQILLKRGIPSSQLPELQHQKKEAVKQVFKEKIIAAQPEVETLAEDIILDKEAEDVKPPAPSPEAAFLAKKAKIQAEGRKLAEVQGIHIRKILRIRGEEETEANYATALNSARRLTSKGRVLPFTQFQSLNIDAMQRWGKSYASPQELAKNYTKDLEANKAEVEAAIVARPTQMPNAMMHMVGPDGKTLAETPGWVGVPINVETEAWRGQMHRTLTGSPQALGFALDLDPEELIKSQAGGATAEDAERLGYLRAKTVLGHAFESTGPTQAKNVRVYAHQSPDGTYGLDPRMYQEAFELYWFDHLLRKNRVGHVGNVSREDAEPLRAEAERLASLDIAKLMNKNRSKGHIVVDSDPKGTNEAIVRGEIGLLGNPDIKIWRAMGFDGLADMMARGRAPLVAMAHPVVNLSPSGEVSYGQSILDVQTEHPMHWFLRAGGWTAVMAWYLDDSDMEWGSLEHVQKIRQGYDFTQDAPEMGERIATNLGIDSEGFERVAGISTAIAMAFMDVDLPSLALLGVTKPLAVLGKGARTASAVSVASDTQRILRALEASGEVADLKKALRNPLLDKTLGAGIVEQLAKHGIELEDPIGVGTPSFKAKKAVPKVAKGAEARAAKKGEKAIEAQEGATTAARELTEANIRYKAKLKELAGVAGKEALEFEVRLTALKSVLQHAKHGEELNRVKFDALVKLLGLSKANINRLLREQPLKIRKGSKTSPLEALAETSNKLIVDEVVKSIAWRKTTEAAVVKLHSTHKKSSKAAAKALDRATLKEGKKLPERRAFESAGDKAARAVADARDALMGAQQKISDSTQAILDVDALVAKVIRETAGRQADALEAYIKLVKEGSPTHIDELGEFKFQNSVANALRESGEQQVTSKVWDLPEAEYLFEGTEIRWVDPKKLVASLQSRSKIPGELKFPSAADIVQRSAAFAERLEEGLKLSPATLGADGLGPAFSNGRHRAIWAANQGQDRIPVITDDVASLQGMLRPAPSSTSTQSGDSILAALQKTYGPRDTWGPAADNWLIRELISREDGIVTLGNNTVNDIFYAEQVIRQGSFLHEKLGDAVLGSAMARMMFDPDAPFMAWQLGSTPAAWTAEGFRFLDGFKKTLSPSKEMFGIVGKRVGETGRIAIERMSGLEAEMAGMLKMGNTLEDVLDYLTSTKGFVLRDGGVTAMNMDPVTIFEKWRKYVLARVAAQAGDQTVDEFLKAGGYAKLDIKALEAIVRSGIPPGHSGKDNLLQARKRVLDKIIEPNTAFTPTEQLWDLVDTSRNAFRVELVQEGGPRAMRDAIQALVLGSVQHDFHNDLVRTLGPITAQQARSMNMVMLGGRRELSQSGKFAELDLFEGLRGLELTGQSMGSTKMRQSFDDLSKASQTVDKWAEFHGDMGFSPHQITAYLETHVGKIIKELEPIHRVDTVPESMLFAFEGWLRLWRRSIVMGLALPKLSHFTNTFFGDLSQVVQARGVLEGGRLMAGNAFTYIPGGYGSRFQDALSDRARAGGMVRLLINPYLASVMRGADDVFVDTADGIRSTKELLKESRLDGVNDFILGRDLIENTARIADPGIILRTKRGMDWWAGHWTDMMMDIQHRHRMAIYLEDRVNRGLSRAEAKANLFEAAYDWKHGATALELKTLAKISAFYMFWRNAFNQMGTTLLEPLTMPAHQYALNAMVGRTKLARASGQGQILMATPEWYYWDDDEQILTDAQQLEYWQKRQTPWWLGARPWLGSNKLTEDEIAFYRKKRGTEMTHETLVLPMFTALDTLYVVTLMTQVAMAKTMGNVELSDNTFEDINDEILGKLGPVFEFFGEAMVNKAAGREDYISEKGVPLRGGEEDMLRMLGLLDTVTMPGTVEEGGRRYLDIETAELTALLFRSTFIVGTEIPMWLSAYNNPKWEQSAQAGAWRTMQNFSGFGKAHAHNPAKSQTYAVKRLTSIVKDLDKKRERMSDIQMDR